MNTRPIFSRLILLVLLTGPAAASARADEFSAAAKAGKFLGLPETAIEAAREDSPALRALGARLFGDTRLSVSGDMACATCHVPAEAFTQNGRATSAGRSGKGQRRNAPTILNVSLYGQFFHDGRAGSLFLQSLVPFTEPDEFANPSMDAVVARVRGLSDYAGRFEAAFGRKADAIAIAAAIAAYERGLLAGGSAFDRWKYGGEAEAISASAKRGFAIFQGKAACAACHLVGKTSASFEDGQFHNTGVGWPGKGVKLDTLADRGREEATGRASDRFKFKTPGLRNVALTAPYMHDGSIKDLKGVVEFYNKGGIRNPTIDPLVRPLKLTDGEIADLVAFLESLTSPRARELEKQP